MIVFHRVTAFIFAVMTLITVSDNAYSDCTGKNCNLGSCDGGGCDMSCLDGETCSCNGGGCTMRCSGKSVCECNKQGCIMDCLYGASCRSIGNASDMRCLGKETVCCGKGTKQCNQDATCDETCALDPTSNDAENAKAKTAKPPDKTLSPISLADAPTLRVEQTIPLEAPVLGPVTRHQLPSYEQTPSKFTFSSGDDFSVLWRQTLSTLRNDKSSVELSDIPNGMTMSRWETDAILDKDGCVFSVGTVESDIDPDQLFGYRFCSDQKKPAVEDPILIASVINNGGLRTPHIIRGDKYHLVVWTHILPDETKTLYLSRVRVTDGTPLEPGGIALPFASDRWAAAIFGDKVLLAWMDLARSKKPIDETENSGRRTYRTKTMESVEEIVRIAWASETKGEFAIAAPVEISKIKWSDKSVQIDEHHPSHSGNPSISISADDRLFLVAWESEGSVLSFRWSMDGRTRLDGVPVRLATTPEGAFPPRQLRTMYNSKKKAHFVSWVALDVTASDADGPDPYRPSAVFGVWVKTSGKKMTVEKQLSLGIHPAPVVTVSDKSLLITSLPKPTDIKPFDLAGIRYTHDGKPLDKAPIPLALVKNKKDDFAAGFGDGVFLTVWKDDRNYMTGGSDLYAMRIRAKDGVVLDKQAFPLSTAKQNQSAPSVSFTEGHFLVVWQDERNPNTGMDIYAARIRAADGAVRDKDGIAITRELSNQANPQGSCDLGACLISWRAAKEPERASIYVREIAVKDGKVTPEKGVLVSAKQNGPVDIRFEKNDRRLFRQAGEGVTEWEDAVLNPKSLVPSNPKKRSIKMVPDDEWRKPKLFLLSKDASFQIGMFSDEGATFATTGAPGRFQTFTMPVWREEKKPSDSSDHSHIKIAANNRVLAFSVMNDRTFRLFSFDAKSAKQTGQTELRLTYPIWEASSQPGLAIDDTGRILMVHSGLMDTDSPQNISKAVLFRK